MKALRYTFLIGSFIFISFMSYTFIMFTNKKTDFMSTKSQMYWAHRQNNLVDLKRSLTQGFQGIEVDVFYNLDKNIFEIKHDKEENSNLNLEEYIKNLPKEIFLWVDFKNLDSENSEMSSLRLYSLFDQYKRLETSIVESQDWYNLRTLYDKDIHTSYWINFNQKSRIYTLRLLALRMLIGLSHYDAFSLDYKKYDDLMRKTLKDFPVLLFTINDKKQLSKYSSVPSVKVILTDKTKGDLP